MQRVRRLAIAAALVLAGCGGGDTAAPSDDPSATASAGGTGGNDEGSAFDCNDALGTMLVFHQEYSYSVRRGTAPEPVDYGELADQLEAFAATAPEDVSTSMADYVDRVVPYWRELGAIGFDPSDPGSTDADESASATATLDGAAVDQSASAIQEWLAGPCEAG